MGDIKAIIFDCFGVLYTDTKSVLRSLVPAEKQQELTDLYTRNDYGYITKEDFFTEVAALTGLTKQEVYSRMNSARSFNEPLVSVIADTLRPRYKIGMLSNIGKGWIDDFFDKHALHALFDDVVLSSEEGMAKPSTDIFLLAANRLGVKPEACLMVDDLSENCEAAQLAGMQAVHFTSNESLLERLYDLHVMGGAD